MKDETKEHMDSTAAQFRLAAGMPKRKSNKPTDPLKPSKLQRVAGEEDEAPATKKPATKGK